MACTPVRFGDTIAIVCHRKPWPETAQCSCAAFAEYLCDYPVGENRTCDRPMCADHAHQVGHDIHYCPGHFREYEAWLKRSGADATLSKRHGQRRSAGEDQS